MQVNQNNIEVFCFDRRHYVGVDRQLHQIVDAFETGHLSDAVRIAQAVVDANPRISQAFNIMSIPTIAFFRPGQQPMGVAGARPMEALEAHFGLAQYAVEAGEPTEAAATEA